MILIDVILIGVIKNYRIFAPKIFNSKIILTPSVFENSVAFRIFTYTFRCSVPQRSPIGKIRCPSVEEAEDPNNSWWDVVTTIPPGSNSSTTLKTCNLWTCASYGSLWVHTDAVIFVLPKINTHFVTTLPTPK